MKTQEAGSTFIAGSDADLEVILRSRFNRCGMDAAKRVISKMSVDLSHRRVSEPFIDENSIAEAKGP
ncbi:hypothetical protein [Paenibacillus sp. 32O-W]|uniref:hypothetical protein n=1 Tax=Paenibacillus sp. 32O-W TaxID=1695218 RepID=UPI00119CF3A6|nr:hypothetical protein [Paenibacillus sp. 32O-W]